MPRDGGERRHGDEAVAEVATGRAVETRRRDHVHVGARHFGARMIVPSSFYQ
jgi:hypothetical protein